MFFNFFTKGEAKHLVNKLNQNEEKLYEIEKERTFLLHEFEGVQVMYNGKPMTVNVVNTHSDFVTLESEGVWYTVSIDEFLLNLE